MRPLATMRRRISSAEGVVRSLKGSFHHKISEWSVSNWVCLSPPCSRQDFAFNDLANNDIYNG